MSKAAKRNFLFFDDETKQTLEKPLNEQKETQLSSNDPQLIHSLKSPQKHKRKSSETLKEKFKKLEFIEQKTLEVYLSSFNISSEL
jgi:hypothetical protein